MDDLINSLKKKLLEFDKESIERDLTRREKKEKEHLKYEIYWAKFKKFKADFERLIFTDVKELANSLETALLEKKIILKTETHRTHITRFFAPDLSSYMIISISDKSTSQLSLWKRSPFLLMRGNQEKGTIELYDCNQDLGYVSDFIKKNAWGSPIKQFKIDEFKFALLKPHIETWLNRNIEKIRDNEDFVTNK
jgi:hypothetical protein